ncbi:hypothetical protein JHK85_053424 [Glycine max]|nr:hypothetical protein JHK85_053424 [Glycine max]
MRRVFYKEKVIPLSRMGKRFWIPPSMMEKVVGHHCMEYELIDPLKNLRSTLISDNIEENRRFPWNILLKSFQDIDVDPRAFAKCNTHGLSARKTLEEDELYRFAKRIASSH